MGLDVESAVVDGEALWGIDALEAHPDFRDWLDEGLRTGFGIGAHEPWTGYAERGFR